VKLAVVGTGYVGLVSATCFAELGHKVIGIDIDATKIQTLQSGRSTIHETGLEELIQRNLKSGTLTFDTDLAKHLNEVEMVFSAVATPPGEGYKADLRAVFAVAETVAEYAEKDILFVNKSTVPVGTGKKCEERMAVILKKRGVSFSIPVISNPEFLREGMAVQDTLMPDRVVVGIDDDNRKARALMEEMYKPVTRVGRPILFMSRESAEIVKYASNSFLAARISFINMLTEFAEKTGANIRDIAQAIGLDHRIGPRFLQAGIGYGGSCFPKDVKAFLSTAKELGLRLPIVEATDEININQRKKFFDKVLESLPKNAHVCLWGLSFKPKTDDMREAPSLDLIPLLLKNKCTVTAFDPFAIQNTKLIFGDSIRYTSDPVDAAKDADAVVLLTEWDIFRGTDMREVQSVMRGRLLFDGRNLYDPEKIEAAGLVYRGIGISGHS
jgi:UDPglucose 6-dehydrogenase